MRGVSLLGIVYWGVEKMRIVDEYEDY